MPVCHLFKYQKPNLSVLTNSGLTSDIFSSTHLTGFNLFGGFSRETHKKGGVTIYICEKLGNEVENHEIGGEKFLK